jgi:hypothetical protein
MASILKPFQVLNPRGQIKPRGPVTIDRSHPVTNDLLFYGFDTGDGLIIDLVTNKPMNSVGTFDVPGVSSYGTGLAYAGAGSKFFAADSNFDAAGSPAVGSGFSWACAYIQTATVGITRIFGRTAGNDAAAPFANWYFSINPQGSGQNVVQAGYYTVSGLVGSTTWTSNANNVFTSLLATALHQTPVNVFTFYTQGQQNSIDGFDAPTSSSANSSIVFSGSSDASVNKPFIGVVFYGAFWGRVLRSDEAALLHSDPYCFLIPAEYEMPAVFAPTVAPVITGGSTLPFMGVG